MYSTEAIASLVGRIGFADFETLSIDPTNKVGSSGRTFSFYHKLVTLKNLYETVEEINMDAVRFNSYLSQLKLDATKHILTEIFNKSKLYQHHKDYSDIILYHPELFDDAIGFSVAISCIQQMIATTRINATVRKTQGAYQALKIELEGLKVDGVVRSVGIKNSLLKSINTTKNILFPDPLQVTSKSIW